MIAIVDYGVNNLRSVLNAFRAVGAEVEVSADPKVLQRADGLVMPGVGAASAGMAQVRARGLEPVIREAHAAGKPILGLCLGMQLLFERSEEGGSVECLGLLPGTVRLLRGGVKIPQIGWNQVETRGSNGIWRDLPPNPYVYFVHSYICEPEDPELVAGRTDYGEVFASAVVSDSIWATQFHPERSGQIGLQMIRNFADRAAA